MSRMTHPTHGVTHAVGPEIEWNIKNGWKIDEEVTPAQQADKPEAARKEMSASERYAEKFGKPPHHRMKPETIEAALQGDSGEV